MALPKGPQTKSAMSADTDTLPYKGVCLKHPTSHSRRVAAHGGLENAVSPESGSRPATALGRADGGFQRLRRGHCAARCRAVGFRAVYPVLLRLARARFRTVRAVLQR